MENKILEVITDAMLEKKAKNVVSLDLRPVGTAITDYFVVCNADSTTAVAAFATTFCAMTAARKNLKWNAKNCLRRY